MNKRFIVLLLGALILLGTAATLFLSSRAVTITENGQARRVNSVALNVGWALHDAGVALSDQDEISPALSAALPWAGAEITIRRAHAVHLWLGSGEPLKSWWTTERVPAQLIAAAGVTLGEADQLLWNGAPVARDAPLPQAVEYLLQVHRPQPAVLRVNQAENRLALFGDTVGDVLWALGLRVTVLDALSAPYNAPLAQTPALTLKPALPFRVQVDGKERVGRSTAATVGEALAQVGAALQGLDTVTPAEDQPPPADGRVRVVRVRVEIELKQTLLPFKSEQVADPNTELDQQSVVQVGQQGVQLARVRVRFEDGREVSRQKETEWVAAQPRNQKIGYGTKVVIRTLDTPDGPIEYWRKVTVYATSFAPCKFIPFIGRCSYTTAAGYPLQKGVIGVGEAWYRLMKGWGVYVAEYGAARVGDYGYIPGFWVDLGYSDADFVNWHRNTTLYFLTPVPANIPWVLPK